MPAHSLILILVVLTEKKIIVKVVIFRNKLLYFKEDLYLTILFY